MFSFQKFTSKLLRLPLKDVDTDMIISAEYLTTTSKDGLGEHVFEHLRKNDETFRESMERLQDAKVLVAGKNFGCGSSREHAPWALTDWGIRVVISSEFADIFKGNAEKNGLLPILLSESDVQNILSSSAEEITVDLPNQTISLSDGSVYSFEISEFSKKRFLEGISDLEYLLGFEESIRDFEKQRKKYTPSS